MCYIDVAAAFGGQSVAAHQEGRASGPAPRHPARASAALGAGRDLAARGACAWATSRASASSCSAWARSDSSRRAFSRRAARASSAPTLRPSGSPRPAGASVDLSQAPLDDAVQASTRSSKRPAIRADRGLRAGACGPAERSRCFRITTSCARRTSTCSSRKSTLVVAREWAHRDLLAARDAIASGSIDGRPAGRLRRPVEAYESAYRTAFDDPSVLKVILQWA